MPTGMPTSSPFFLLEELGLEVFVLLFDSRVIVGPSLYTAPASSAGIWSERWEVRMKVMFALVDVLSQEELMLKKVPPAVFGTESSWRTLPADVSPAEGPGTIRRSSTVMVELDVKIEGSHVTTQTEELFLCLT